MYLLSQSRTNECFFHRHWMRPRTIDAIFRHLVGGHVSGVGVKVRDDGITEKEELYLH